MLSLVFFTRQFVTK